MHTNTLPELISGLKIREENPEEKVRRQNTAGGSRNLADLAATTAA
jgi:hypothetical protein